MRFFKWVLAVLVAAVVASLAWLYHRGSHQGRAFIQWEHYKTAQVRFDSDGIATLDAPSWNRLIEAQGFVVASERLWQMDLMRRSASGKLAEWFGGQPRVIAWDTERRNEQWEAVAVRAVDSLPADERQHCDLFAKGVNAFIRSAPSRWGIEYALLGEKPEPWECRDSLLILLSMADDLTSIAEQELLFAKWREHLPKTWQALLFPQIHPWNKVLFGKNGRAAEFPKQAEWIPRRPLARSEKVPLHESDEFFRGSNAWAVREGEKVLVANDPHLSYSVPQLWFPIRLRRTARDWVVGASIPGVPGIVLGRNASIAWGFTNAKEDVDDLLVEELNRDATHYVAKKIGKRKIWKPLQRAPYTIRVRAEEAVRGEALLTHRGPVKKRDGVWYSRQWLGFQPGMLRLPVVRVMRATEWAAFNRALDGFFIPAQAVVFADRSGALGLRLSGRGIRRAVSGLVPVSASEGEWKGFEPVDQRPRLFTAGGSKKTFFATANQRLYDAKYGAYWSSDLRQERIIAMLTGPEPINAERMQAMQLDDYSRFLKTLVDWTVQHASAQNAAQSQMIERWNRWDGRATSDEPVFAQAVYLRGLLSGLLLARVRHHFLGSNSELPYEWRMQSGWQLTALQHPQGLQAFGLESHEVAEWLLRRTEQGAARAHGYSEVNRWKAQHPLARGVPVLGRLFEISEEPQVGYEGLVRVERPLSGASTRLIWDFSDPQGGRWAFPVGASGHPLSRNYTNFRKRWFQAQFLPVLPKEHGPWEVR